MPKKHTEETVNTPEIVEEIAAAATRQTGDVYWVAVLDSGETIYDGTDRAEAKRALLASGEIGSIVKCTVIKRSERVSTTVLR